jgi:hypothetical protein
VAALHQDGLDLRVGQCATKVRLSVVDLTAHIVRQFSDDVVALRTREIGADGMHVALDQVHTSCS